MNLRHATIESLRGRRWRGYVRESTAAQADGWSPERQRQDIANAATELGMLEAEPSWYTRTGSGEKASDELEQALADAIAGQYEVLVVLTTSRFGRNRTEVARRKGEFRAAGIPVYFVQDRIVSGARSSRLLEGIREVIDEEENEQRRFFIAGGLRERQLAGQWVGAIPYGMRKHLADRPDGTRGWDGTLEDDPATIDVLRQIRSSTNHVKLTESLNERGVPSPRGGEWNRVTVWRIARNPIYEGRMVRYRRSTPAHYFEESSRDGRQEVAR